MRLNSRTTSPWSALAWCLGALAFGAGFAGAAEVHSTTNTPVSPPSETNSVGSWIWDTATFDKQTCRFWPAFEIPHFTLARALLRITVDNGYRLFLDGRV